MSVWRSPLDAIRRWNWPSRTPSPGTVAVCGLLAAGVLTIYIASLFRHSVTCEDLAWGEPRGTCFALRAHYEHQAGQYDTAIQAITLAREVAPDNPAYALNECQWRAHVADHRTATNACLAAIRTGDAADPVTREAYDIAVQLLEYLADADGLTEVCSDAARRQVSSPIIANTCPA